MRLTGANHGARTPREVLEGLVRHEIHLHPLVGEIDALDAVRHRQAAIGDHEAVSVTHAREHTAHIPVEMSVFLHRVPSRNALSSADEGMLSCAPRLATERAPAAHPRRTASGSPR